MGCACQGKNIAVAGGVDDDVGHDRAAARAALYYHALHAAIFDNTIDRLGMKEEANLRTDHQFVRQNDQLFRIEGNRIANMVGALAPAQAFFSPAIHQFGLFAESFTLGRSLPPPRSVSRSTTSWQSPPITVLPLPSSMVSNRITRPPVASPPKYPLRSSRVTSAPRRAADTAAAKPDAPPPTTNT